MFDKILIANRGEIACRIIKTARRMGIRTVAVYSDADENSRHVALADEACHIGPSEVSESYLKSDRIIEVACATGAQAIHPGFGFLSENAEFAEACAAADITFIGPSPDAIRSMGLKDQAKALMEDAGVPVVPGYHGKRQTKQTLMKAAEGIGYPVLIKAVAGGGGRGMRLVETAEDFEEALLSARREATTAFGDDRVLVEKYITRPRHIEVQVFGDQFGNAVHLFERDCSLQRRYQKVVEEAPAPDMPAGLRDRMGAAAVAAAQAISYSGAGTVEFIVDAAGGLDGALANDGFYFMEMNTRLQVEHPVTEMITGHDLVEWQLRVAAGEKLPVSQDGLSVSGHAIEVRLYAEDPARDFLPATGTLARLRLGDHESPNLRIDTGVREGDEVSIYYDPMIAKLIVWDHDRPTALRRLRHALAECQIAGVATNLAFLSGVAAHPAFASGDLDTGFIERYHDDLIPDRGEQVADQGLALGSLAVLAMRARSSSELVQSAVEQSPWEDRSAWRLNDDGGEEICFIAGEHHIAVNVRHRRDHFELTLPGGVVSARGEIDDDGELLCELDGQRIAVSVVQQGDELTVMGHGASYRLQIFNPLSVEGLDEADSGAVTAPMPAKITRLLIAAGDQVRRGQAMLVLEAMKMEHTLTAPADGIVDEIHFAVGDQVAEGMTLVNFVADDA